MAVMVDSSRQGGMAQEQWLRMRWAFDTLPPIGSHLLISPTNWGPAIQTYRLMGTVLIQTPIREQGGSLGTHTTVVLSGKVITRMKRVRRRDLPRALRKLFGGGI